MKLQIATMSFIVISALVALIVGGFENHQVFAQTNTSNGNGNMTSAMVMLARFHLKAADTELANGNNTAALNELTMAQLQVLALGMKPMGTVDMAHAMQLMKSTGHGAFSSNSVPDNCIILKGGVLECRDSLTQTISLSNQTGG